MLCDRRMPTRLKEGFYRTTIRPTITYGVECWPIKKQYMHKIDIVEIRILNWMCGKTRNARIRNEYFLEHLRIAAIRDKIKETRLRWFEHVQCRLVTVLVKKSLVVKVNGPTKERGGQR